MSELNQRAGEGWALRLPEEHAPESLLSRVDVVLCRPDGSANVGSVCRAIKSMGLSSLLIVGRTAEFFQRSEVAQMALSAFDLFQQASFQPSLPQALQGVALAAGLSRRRGSFRKYFAYAPEQLAEKALSLETGRIAIVLGNERNGLSDEEMSCCHVACAIPTSPAFPSLNLSHAAQIIAYHFFRAYHANYRMGMSAIEQNEVEQTARMIVAGLETLGLPDHDERHRSYIFFRDLIVRAGLSPLEARRLRRLLQTVSYRSKNQTPAAKSDDRASPWQGESPGGCGG